MRLVRHFRFDPLHSASADLVLLGNLHHAKFASSQRAADFIFFGRRERAWPPKRLPRLTGAVKSGIYAAYDHLALKLTKRANDMEHEFAFGRGCVDVLLVDEHIHAALFEELDSLQEINQRSPHAVDCPDHHNIELVAFRIREHLIQPRAILAALRARYARVLIGSNYIPAAMFGGLRKRLDLIFNSLLVGRYADIQRSALGFSHDATASQRVSNAPYSNHAILNQLFSYGPFSDCERPGVLRHLSRMFQWGFSMASCAAFAHRIVAGFAYAVAPSLMLPAFALRRFIADFFSNTMGGYTPAGIGFSLASLSAGSGRGARRADENECYVLNIGRQA